MSTTDTPTTAYVGLDLSLASTGVAVLGAFGPSVDRIKTGTTEKSSIAQLARLRDITDMILRALPTAADRLVVAIEGPAFGRNDVGAHMRAGLWWMVREVIAVDADEVLIIPPSSVKKYATGKGNAQKDAVLAAVVRRYPDVDVTGNDEADALVLAAMAARHDGHPIETGLPQTNLDAMRGIGA